MRLESAPAQNFAHSSHAQCGITLALECDHVGNTDLPLLRLEADRRRVVPVQRLRSSD